MHSKKATLIVFLTLVAAAPAGAQGVRWRQDLESAKQEAAQSKKLVLLHFWSTTCAPCVALDNTVFNQPNVGSAIEQQFVPVKVNASESQALAQAYGVTKIPTDIVLDSNGQVVRRMVSPSSPMAYLSAMTQVAGEYAARSSAAYQAAANASPYGPAVNNAYSELSLPPALPQTAALQQQAAGVAGVPGVTENRYAASAPTATNPVTPATPGVAPGAVSNPYTAATPAAAPVTATAATQTTASVAAAQPALPPGSPPLGFEGFCTVTMQRDFKWAKGDAAWGAIHRGRTYLFAGAAERDEFLKNPDQYSPVLSGLDPVAAVEQNQSVAGKRQFAVQYPAGTGQIYMFSTAENLNKFSTNAAGFAEGVRQAMTTDSGRMIR